MKTLRTLLREGDPLDREPPLSTDDVERMRRTVLTAGPADRSTGWTMPVVVAAFSLVVGALVWAGRSAAPPEEPLHNTGRRQVQFATPGGTRIIWVFDSHFDVR